MSHYPASLHIAKCEFRDGIGARLLFLLHPKLSVAASVESLGANYLTEYTHVGMLAPTVALARGGGGFGGGGGGFHGGGGLGDGGFHGGGLGGTTLLAEADFTAGPWQAANSMAVASTMGFTMTGALEATAITPMTMATTTTGIRTTPTAIPITTMVIATRCSGACIRASVGTFTRSRSAADPAASDG